MKTRLMTAVTLSAVAALAALLAAGPATQPSAPAAAAEADCCMTPAAVSVAHEASAQPAAAQPATEVKADAKALFEKLKGLAGKWEGKSGDTDVSLEYAVTGGGSAVVETLTLHGGMTTVYTLDEPNHRVVMTHYCAAGNQPRMVSKGLVGDTAKFEFLDATGMASPNDPHMHNLTLTFPTASTYKQAWTMYQGGKSGGDVVFDLKSVK